MAAFEYAALNARGKEEKGVLEADSVRQVRQMLRDRGFVPLSVAPSSSLSEGESIVGRFFSPSMGVKDLALITRQLATLIAAAIPIEEALMAVSQQTEKTRIEGMLLAVRSKVLEGYSLGGQSGRIPKGISRSLPGDRRCR